MATMRAIDHPIFGFDMTVTTTVHYDLRSIPEGALQTREIVARGTATVGDAFIGMERERIASERSAQDNIRKLLDWLATAQ